MKTCSHTVLGVIMEHPACGKCPSQEELEEHAKWFLDAIEHHRKYPKLPGEDGYEFWQRYQ